MSGTVSSSLVLEHDRGSLLSSRTAAWFHAREVPFVNLGMTAHGDLSMVRADSVVFRKPRRFEFARYAKRADDAVQAFTFIARDQFGEPADIVAWEPRENRLATWRGLVSLLGEEQAFVARLDDEVTLHANPLDWLRAGRRGLVVVDPARARSILLDAGPIVVPSLEQGQNLRKLLERVRLPKILVSQPDVGSAA